jgi:hypothetical protein
MHESCNHNRIVKEPSPAWRMSRLGSALALVIIHMFSIQ